MTVLSDFSELWSSFPLARRTRVKKFSMRINYGTLCMSATKFGSVRGLAIRHFLFPKLGNFGPEFRDADTVRRHALVLH